MTQKFVFSCVEAKNVIKMDVIGKSDPYIIISLLDQDDQKPFKTEAKDNTSEPTWNEEGFFTIKEDYSQTVKFEMYDEDIKNDDKIGSYTIKMSDVKQKLTGINDEWVDLVPDPKLKGKKPGELHLKYCITDIDL
ncbi:Extended synaptotagmin-3 [Tritrichomonas musculus]|uniref:Extended synaptotagmin-3 n=1 Tax=Tritrichomonas musculus TaxID=1915356 RepID=A0ABR2KTC0_9EUKA